MRRSTNSLSLRAKVGLFVCVCLVLLGAGILFIGQYSKLFQSTRTIDLILPHAQELQAGAPVRLAGINVGVIDSLALLDDPQKSSVRVTLSIHESASRRLRADARAVLRTPGLWGQQYVELIPGHKERTWSDTPQPLQGTLGARPGEVVTNVESTLKSLQGVLHDIRDGQGSVGKLTSDPTLYDSLVRLTGELHGMVQAINQSQGTLGRLLRSEAVHERMLTLLRHADAVVTRFQNPQGTVGKLVHDASLHDQTMGLLQKLKRATDQINTVLATFDGTPGTAAKLVNDARLYEESLQAVRRFASTTQRLDHILTRLEEGSGSAGLLLSDAELYRNLNTLITHATTLVQDIQRRPERYVRLKIF